MALSMPQHMIDLYVLEVQKLQNRNKWRPADKGMLSKCSLYGTTRVLKILALPRLAAPPSWHAGGFDDKSA